MASNLNFASVDYTEFIAVEDELELFLERNNLKELLKPFQGKSHLRFYACIQVLCLRELES